MTDPATPVCLTMPYSSKPAQRGGTLIAEGVRDLMEHARRAARVDRYRPERCESCLGEVLHGHGWRERTLRMGDWTTSEQIRRYRCVGCGGIWQILPAVIARCLHRTWEVVQAAAQSGGALKAHRARGSTVPKRTIRRWIWRLALSTCVLMQALAVTVSDPVVDADTPRTRGELVDALAASGDVVAEHKLAQVAGWVHRFAAGVRLM